MRCLPSALVSGFPPAPAPEAAARSSGRAGGAWGEEGRAEEAGARRPPRLNLQHPWVGAVKPSGGDGGRYNLFYSDSDLGGLRDRWPVCL